jgi:hypothetical protein
VSSSVRATRRSAWVSATGKRSHDRLERPNVVLREASGPYGRPADGVNFPIGEPQWLDEIVGDPLGPEFLDDAEISRAARIGEAAADRSVPAHDQRDRAREIAFGPEKLVGRFADLHLLPWPPEKAAAHNVGVQRAHEYRDPVQRQAARREPLAERRVHVLRSAQGRRAIDQPLDDPADGVLRLCLWNRPASHARHLDGPIGRG